GRQLAGQDAEQRGLPCPVAPEQAHPLTPLEPQGHPIEQRRLTERQRDVVELEKRHVMLTCPCGGDRRRPTSPSTTAAPLPAAARRATAAASSPARSGAVPAAPHGSRAVPDARPCASSGPH